MVAEFIPEVVVKEVILEAVTMSPSARNSTSSIKDAERAPTLIFKRSNDAAIALVHQPVH